MSSSMRWLFAGLVTVHGLIHLLGVVEGGGPCHGQKVTLNGQADAGSSCGGGVGFGVASGEVEGLFLQGVHFKRPGLRVNEPEFADAGAFVERKFVAPVVFGG